MAVIVSKPLDERIVVFGQSCVGKTTFAKLLPRYYYEFDALFHWHAVEVLGLSPEQNLVFVKERCNAEMFVLDGWHLSDRTGIHLPDRSVVYLVYAPYEQIIRQYRVPIVSSNEHRSMFEKWYVEVEYEQLPGTRYFLNNGEFVETSRFDFLTFLSTRNR